MNIAAPDDAKIKEISEDILKSMLKRSFPAVDATHFFKKYANGKTPDHQFMHALAMMDKGGILRIDKTDKPFSVTFVLLENDGSVKMHHMIDDEYESDTFGCMFDDPYEGPKKRIHCYEHIMSDEKAKAPDCEKCRQEEESKICMSHRNILSKCEKCKLDSKIIKAATTKEQADQRISEILQAYKKQYWSYDQ